MTRWTKTMSLVAVALCSGMTITATNARAEEAEETATSEEAIIDDTNNDLSLETRADDVETRLDLIDPNYHRRGFGSCYSICDGLLARCLRSYYPPRPVPYLRELRHLWNDNYRRCERRFDHCVAVCRGPILYNR